MTRRPRALLAASIASAVVTVAVWVTTSGRTSGDARVESAARPVLLASGRDDHGLLASATVGLARTPGGPPTDEVGDGTLVRVVRAEGEWLEVRSVDGTNTGWVNDFYLRGVVHLRAAPTRCQVVLAEQPHGSRGPTAAANTQATMVDVARHRGATWVLVDVGRGARGWVPRSAVSELPGDRVVAHPRGCLATNPPPSSATHPRHDH